MNYVNNSNTLPQKLWKHTQPLVCEYCRRRLVLSHKRATKATPLATVDHRTPTFKGGKDVASNWAMCCEPCNNLKGPLTEAQYRAMMAANNL